MKSLEIQRIKLQIAKVETGKMEMEFKILERKEDIKRLEREIENQTNTINELKEKLKKD